MKPSRSKNGITRRELLGMVRPKGHMSPTIRKEKCTGCGLCTMDCAEGAITILQSEKEDTYQLLFRNEICNACGICEKSCPENCLQLEPASEPGKISGEARVIFEDKISRCLKCGIPLFPLAMVSHLRSKLFNSGGGRLPFDLCPSCRIKISSETARVTKA